MPGDQDVVASCVALGQEEEAVTARFGGDMTPTRARVVRRSGTKQSGVVS
jgi:hypothetical protein